MYSGLYREVKCMLVFCSEVKLQWSYYGGLMYDGLYTEVKMSFIYNS